MKRRLVSFLTALALCLSLFPPGALAADTESDAADTDVLLDESNNDIDGYSGTDIAVINAMIKNNGLALEKNDPAGWAKPPYVVAWDNKIPKRIIRLNLMNQNLTGELDVSELSALTQLNCEQNQLTSLNVSGLTALKQLSCEQNQLTSLNVSDLTALTQLSCQQNQLTGLNVSGLTALTDLTCFNNQLTELDVSENTTLKKLMCSHNGLTELDVSELTALQELSCSENQLTMLDVSALQNLTTLTCNSNQLTTLILPDTKTTLKWLSCYGNQLTALDVSNYSALTTLLCYDNPLLTSLTLAGASSLKKLTCYNSQLTEVDATGLTELTEVRFSTTPLESYTTPDGQTITVTPPVGGTVAMSVTGPKTVRLQAAYNFTAGYNFAYWEGLPAGTVNRNNDVTFTVNDNVTANAVFKWRLNSHTLIIPDQPYTGQPIEPIESITNAQGHTFRLNQDFTCAYENNTNVGTASVKVTSTTDGIAAGNFNFYFQIVKAVPEVTAPTGSVEYGQTLSQGTLTGGSAVNSYDGTTVAGSWGWEDGTVQPLESGPFPAVFTPDDTVNYAIPESAEADVTVTPTVPVITLSAPSEQIRGGTVNVICSAENPHDAALASGLPDIALTWQIGSGVATEITGSSFIIPEGTAPGTVITITAASKAVVGKYAAATETTAMTVTDKTHVNISGVTAENAIYDGGQHTGYTGMPASTNYPGDYEITYSGRNGTACNIAEAPTNAGDYSVTIAVPDDDAEFTGSITLAFSVAKKQLTWDASGLTASKPAGTAGEAAVYGSLALSGVLGGEVTLDGPSALKTSGFDAVTAGTYTVSVVPGSEGESWLFTPADPENYILPGGNPIIQAVVNAVAETPVKPPELPPDTEALQTKLEVETGISGVPDSLADNTELNTPAKIVNFLKTVISSVDSSLEQANTAVYDAKLMVKISDGDWEEADAGNFPEDGRLTITLPYPAGTGQFTHSFVVTHMFTTNDFGKEPGRTEQPAVTNTADGIRCTVTGLSPIAVAWKALSAGAPTGGSTSSTSGGSSAASYAVTVKDSTHGRVSASRTKAESGATVTLTVTPDEGYELDTLTVTDSRGNNVRISGRDGRFTFTMPVRAVTVEAEFVRSSTPAEADSHPDCPARAFYDLDTGEWYHEAVDFVLGNGLMNGTSSGFAPNAPLSRAMLAQILWNHAGRPMAPAASAFRDIPADEWYTGAVDWASAAGIVSGYTNGRFGPNDPITREQFVLMLWHCAGSPAAGNPALSAPDAGQIGSYAMEAMQWAVSNGILTGKSGGLLDPQGRATRAEAAQTLRNFVS